MLLSIACAVHAQAVQSIRVRAGSAPVMIDGKLAAGEWDDAKQFNLGDAARVCVKESNGFVWLAIEVLKEETFTADLYVATDDGRVTDLHSSAKLGERVAANGKFSDTWTWWNNDRWVANYSRVDSWDSRTFMPEKVREFQIARSRFPGKRWRIMFGLMTPAPNNWTSIVFPPSAKDTDPSNWITLEFD
jgi:hypothetical protein